MDDSGDGFIRVISVGDGDPADGSGPPLAVQGLESGVAEQLLNYYFDTHASHFPVVSRADFAAQGSPSLLLFNTLCGISALSHHVSPSILRTIKATTRCEWPFHGRFSTCLLQRLLTDSQNSRFARARSPRQLDHQQYPGSSGLRLQSGIGKGYGGQQDVEFARSGYPHGAGNHPFWTAERI